LEIEEKINKVRWCKSSNNTKMLLSTNDKTIKLWKVGCALQPAPRRRSRRRLGASPMWVCLIASRCTRRR
jgi:hypothetical protein